MKWPFSDVLINVHFHLWLITISYADKLLFVEYLWILCETTDAVLAKDSFYAIFSEELA